MGRGSLGEVLPPSFRACRGSDAEDAEAHGHLDGSDGVPSRLCGAERANCSPSADLQVPLVRS